MRKFILSFIVLLFLAASFPSHNLPGWYQIAVPRSDVTVQDMYFTDNATGFVVNRKNTGDSVFIIKTTNGGNNWSTVLAEQINLICINFPTKDVGYSAGSSPPGIIKKTTNAGNNWFTVAISPVYPFVDIKFVNKDTGWVCSNNTIDGGLFKTTNGGVNWQVQLNQTYTPSKLFFINKDTGWVTANNFYLYKTTNGGVNWIEIFHPSDAISNIFFIDKNIGWLTKGSESSPFARTTNGGFNWKEYPKPLVGGAIFDMYFISSNKGWAVDPIGRAIYSLKNDTLWGTQTISTGTFSNRTIFMVDSLTGYSGGSKLIKTDDGGGLITGVNSLEEEIISDYKLYQNYPNPFNPVTSFKFQVPISSFVSIKVYDLQGKEVALLVNEKKNAGSYSINFDANKYNLSSGIYFYTLQTENYKETKKMILVK